MKIKCTSCGWEYEYEENEYDYAACPNCDLPYKHMDQFYEIDDLILLIYQHLSFMEITQKELAERVGISQQYLSDILHKHRNPSNDLLKYFKLEKREIYIPLYAD